MEFTREQVDLIEDRVCNMIQPVYGALDMAVAGEKSIGTEEAQRMQDHLNGLVSWVRGLRG